MAKRRAEAEQQGYRKQQLQQRQQSGQGQQQEEEQAEPKGEGFIPFYSESGRLVEFAGKTAGLLGCVCLKNGSWSLRQNACECGCLGTLGFEPQRVLLL